MLRTPARTALFFFLILVSMALLSVGLDLWYINRDCIRELEQGYMTIATVEQKRENVSYMPLWDAGTKDYSYVFSSSDGRWIDPEELDFEGADYIQKPKKRVFFGAYMPEYVLYNTEDGYDFDYMMESANRSIIAEVEPLWTGKAAPVKVRVKRLLMGNENLFLGDLWICDHYNPDPPVLERGKTYIVSLVSGMTRHDTGNDEDLSSEYTFSELRSTQCTAQGEQVTGSFEGLKIDEVTDGFYETEKGRQWLAVLDEQYLLVNTVPVQPVDDLRLLRGFYEGNAYVEEGREFTEGEYKEGASVCLVPDLFAKMNGLQVGDKITLPLIYANYVSPANVYPPSGSGIAGGFSLIDADGQLYQPFAEIGRASCRERV